MKLWTAAFCSEYFSLQRNGSERNSKSLLLYLFHGTEFRFVFSSAEMFGREFREFAYIFVQQNGIPNFFSSAEGLGTEFREFSVPRKSRNSVGSNHLFRLFRLPRKYFLSEIPNPNACLVRVRQSSAKVQYNSKRKAWVRILARLL